MLRIKRSHQYRRLALLGVASAILSAASAGGASASSRPSGTAGYIVVLKASVAGVEGVASEHAARYGARVRYVYHNALRGYAADLPRGTAARIAADARVAFVERDGVVRADTTQPGATWGIDRIDQRSLPLSTTFTYTNTGAGVTAYIVDTGARFTHTEFGGRAISGYDAIDGGTADDCNGHGTHVAGTLGGTTYGVAKGVTLVAVRVLNCSGSGTTSQVISGLDWVTGDHDPGESAVANMSLGGSASTALDNAVRNSISDGVSYAIAAGNGNIFGTPQNACNYSPARVSEAMTISATQRNDRRASWANFGNCVDWFAPGVDITSSWYSSDTATNTISGTSMATPHTAGVAALYLQSNPAATPQVVRDALFALTTKNIVTKHHSTVNNDLLFTDL